MLKGRLGGYLVLGLLFVMAVPAWAAEGKNALPVPALALAMLGAGLSIGLGAIGSGIGLGNAAAKAMEAIGRNPEAAGTIRNVMLIGLAFIEAVAIYALVIAFILSGKIPL